MESLNEDEKLVNYFGYDEIYRFECKLRLCNKLLNDCSLFNLISVCINLTKLVLDSLSM